MAIDRSLFRQVMGQFLTGVTAVTTATAEGLHGFTASAFCRVSDNPPLVLLCVDRLNRGCDSLLTSGSFAVSILSERQEFLAERLAGRAPGLTRQFEGVSYFTRATGSPILHGCLGWLDCRVETSHEAGDHTIFVGRVQALDVDERLTPLLFLRSAYRHLNA